MDTAVSVFALKAAAPDRFCEPASSNGHELCLCCGGMTRIRFVSLKSGPASWGMAPQRLGIGRIGVYRLPGKMAA
jgi:hypothetical protein